MSRQKEAMIVAAATAAIAYLVLGSILESGHTLHGFLIVVILAPTFYFAVNRVLPKDYQEEV